VAAVELPEGGVLLRPPPPGDELSLEGVAAATREALRFPLSGEPLARLAKRGGSATVVIELPNLPIPSATPDPRHEAIAATVDELSSIGVSKVTILVAGGLQRRPSPREIGLLVAPDFRRRFRGLLTVHDAEGDDLVELGSVAGIPVSVSPALVHTDLVVTVSAAESVLHGGPATLVHAASRAVLRASGASSLLEASTSQGWRIAVELERLLGRQIPLLGVSLALNLPRVLGGYPYGPDALERIASSRLRPGLSLLPSGLRKRLIERVPRELSAAAVYGGSPSTAHSEALLRAIAFKGVRVEAPFDAIVIGIPATTPFLPREMPNPVSAAYLALGLALRLWRGAFPVTEGGTAILLHDLQRRFPAPTQTPYRALFAGERSARDRDALREAERAALSDPRGIDAYRAGRAVHPLEPFLAWSACDAAVSRLGSVLIAGCRDAPSARQLGFVPVHGVGAALSMARAGGARRIGFLLSPPYFPLLSD
jgi:hypothetical protein